MLVSKSLSVDKDRTTIPTLITALFHDLSPDKEPKIPTQGEKRERELQRLIPTRPQADRSVRRRSP